MIRTRAALTLTAKWMVARVLDDDADFLRRGIERRLCRIAGTVGQCAELHRECDGILGLVQV